jgi:hypothetical protein
VTAAEFAGLFLIGRWFDFYDSRRQGKETRAVVLELLSLITWCWICYLYFTGGK